jgi:DNA replication protein DnaC
MLNQATVDKMQEMRMPAMAETFLEQSRSSQYADLSFEERVGLLVDAEWTYRQQRKLDRRLKAAKLRYPASLEDVDYRASRGLDRQVVLSLAGCSWIEEHQNVILTGPTGTGKTYLACALAERACRSGYSAYYARAPRLFHDLGIARADGSYGRLLVRLAKTQLLAIDDWLITPLKEPERQDLLEVIEDRSERASTLIATQLDIDAWHAAIGDPTIADAVCDRLIHRAHRIDLKGSSLREPTTATKRKATANNGKEVKKN